MKSFLLVATLFVLWFLSMLFYMPLPLTIVLFAALASAASIVSWLSLMKRFERRSRAVVKPDAKARI